MDGLSEKYFSCSIHCSFYGNIFPSYIHRHKLRKFERKTRIQISTRVFEKIFADNRNARNDSLKAHGIEFLLVAWETGLDIGEAFSIGKLGETPSSADIL